MSKQLDATSVSLGDASGAKGDSLFAISDEHALDLVVKLEMDPALLKATDRVSLHGFFTSLKTAGTSEWHGRPIDSLIAQLIPQADVLS
jgi:hypothetical protein